MVDISDDKLLKDESADFLRRLSIADAKVLLENTRRERETKTKEMQQMIGVRYRDLIESADKIVNMHSAALRLEKSLKGMPKDWETFETKLDKVLTPSDNQLQVQEENIDEILMPLEESFGSIADKVQYIVNAPEQMWKALDQADSIAATKVYLKAQEIYQEVDSKVMQYDYSFVLSYWESILSFRTRIVSCALEYLECRKVSVTQYASSICTLVVLGEYTCADVIQKFLEARSRWITSHLSLNDTSDTQTESQTTRLSFSESQSLLILILRTVIFTLTHVEQLFINFNDECAFLDDAFKRAPNFEADLKKLTDSDELATIIAAWVDKVRNQVEINFSYLFNAIKSVSYLCETQQKLCNNEDKYFSLKSSIWQDVQLKLHNGTSTSIFNFIFAKHFRQRARSLVHHSFVDALDTIQCRIQEKLVDLEHSGDNLVGIQPSAIPFYDLFDGILNNATELDSSELQDVLTEELMRTLWKFLHFLETTFPSKQRETVHVNVLLGISNILAGISSNFLARMKYFFPNDTGSNKKQMDWDYFSKNFRILSAFEEFSCNGHLENKSLTEAMQLALNHTSTGELVGDFIDSELQNANNIGFYTFSFVCAIKKQSASSQYIASLIYKMSCSYCEAWTGLFLEQNVIPLRITLMREEYKIPSDEWLTYHDGWAQFTISNNTGDNHGNKNGQLSANMDSDENIIHGTTENDFADTKNFTELMWLPCSETPTLSSLLFSCCYTLDDIRRRLSLLTQGSGNDGENHIRLMYDIMQQTMAQKVQEFTLNIYNDIASYLVKDTDTKSSSALSCRNCCTLQYLFDIYFVQVILGHLEHFQDALASNISQKYSSTEDQYFQQVCTKFQELIITDNSNNICLKVLENVAIRARKSRLLFSSLCSQATNNATQYLSSATNLSFDFTTQFAVISPPVARFSLLPVPSRNRPRRSSSTQLNQDINSTERLESSEEASKNGTSLENGDGATLSMLNIQNLLSGSASSNILSAATSGSNFLSSAAKGMNYLSTATSSYLREGDGRTKYF